MIHDAIRREIEKRALGIPFALEHTARAEFGDYSANVAFAAAEREKRPPREIAAEYAEQLRDAHIPGVEKIEVAGAGFINFYLSDAVFAENLAQILKEKDAYGCNRTRAGEKILVEYTDPNPFKEFHIGHVMSNAIGEAIARLFDAAGADVKRANYQGDVGLHVAKAVYAMERQKISVAGLRLWGSRESRMRFLGGAYAYGNREYESNAEAKTAIERVNKELYENKNPHDRAHDMYRVGRQWSLDYFDAIYEKLGTEFDFKFFESETGPIGKKIVDEGLKNGVFENSEGAVVFRGEKFGLHTRVFLNSEGLPTYEAKELGLAQLKREKFPYDLSVTVTGNEVADYFRVVLKAMEKLWGEEFVQKIRHIPHGMLRLPEGKMSSRTGTALSADLLFERIRAELQKIIKGRRGGGATEKIEVGAIKYSVLKQAIGRDIVFDFQKSVSLEGDSGPYLQYAHARAHSVVEKARLLGVRPSAERPEKPGGVERALFAFPDAVTRAQKAFAPHFVATYLIELARVFNAYYAETRIADADAEASYRVALAAAVAQTLKNGLNLLGIPAPERM